MLELCADIDAEFIAKTAVFCRERGFMKDMPALLCAVLSVKDRELLARVFPRVIDNAKMLRNFVQIMRSGDGSGSTLISIKEQSTWPTPKPDDPERFR